MSVSSILKGAGKFVKSELGNMGEFAKDTYKAGQAKRGPKYTVGPGDIIQRSRGKNLKDPMAMYQQVLPYHINQKYTVPLALGAVGTMAVAGGISQYNQAKLGTVTSGEGLSAMTEGGIDGASANVITPGLKAMNDTSSAQARQQSAEIRDNMQHTSGTRGAEGDIVFALHNMR